MLKHSAHVWRDRTARTRPTCAEITTVHANINVRSATLVLLHVTADYRTIMGATEQPSYHLITRQQPSYQVTTEQPSYHLVKREQPSNHPVTRGQSFCTSKDESHICQQSLNSAKKKNSYTRHAKRVKEGKSFFFHGKNLSI